MITKKRYFLLNKLILIAAVFTTMSAAYGDTDYYAVLIGINDYLDEGHEDFNYAIADIQLVEDMLVQAGDWSIENIRMLEDEDATENGILDSIEAMGNKADGDDVCLIMFSGHGSAQGAIKGLVTYDDRPEVEAWHRISPSELNSWINAYFYTDKIMVILDACYTGGFYNQIDKGVILMACQADEHAIQDDEYLMHSVFTYFIGQGMAGYADLAGSSLSAEEIFDYAAPRRQRLRDKSTSFHPTSQCAYSALIIDYRKGLSLR
ncbi:unnamed protein product [marine sediment metagenome]|uniref:Peptidase C14 caspase domain-containing protein n=1 Tax=marine sediment metagenome TaxID=412755 RepID=X1LAB8_9ZZZZ